MKIAKVESLHCDAGWRNFSFCKITADSGLIGWSEYQEGFGSPGVSAVIQSLVPVVMGKDPHWPEKIYWDMYAVTRPAAGGVVAQGMAAIENALLDLKAKSLGVPVYELLGGKLRDKLRVYWSHCGTYRVTAPEVHGQKPVLSLKDITAMGREVREKGFTALKTNIFLFESGRAELWAPGFNRPTGYPELNVERNVVEALQAELNAFREGAGPGVEILLDLNFNGKTEGYLKLVRALAPQSLFWIEIDSYDAEALSLVRRASTTPIASGETLFGIREFRPYFEHHSLDVAIIDAIWNGVWQSMKIAALAESYEVNVACHNFYGHLSSMMNAHFCAALPNFRIMEIDIDQVPHRDELFTVVPKIENSYLTVPTTPGWGTEPNEAALKKYPPKRVTGGLLERT
jgi:L-alanine-DL-glutamate epimerase-like enolase superfamily enzyme